MSENDSGVGHFKRIYKPSDYTIQKENPNAAELIELNALNFRGRLEKLFQQIQALDAYTDLCVTQPHRFSFRSGDLKLGIPEVLGKEYSGVDYDNSLLALNEQIKSVCGMNNTIDLYNADFKAEHFYDGVHTNPLGSKLIGEVLAANIATNWPTFFCKQKNADQILKDYCPYDSKK